MERNPKGQAILRVLIIEDDEAQSRTLSMILRSEGFDVVACTRSAEALERLANGDIDVAVVDLRLPDMDETELLAKLSDQAERVPMIINTGYGSYTSAREAVNKGAFAYLEKGKDPAELIGHVHRAIATRLTRRSEELEAVVAERTRELDQSNKALRRDIIQRKVAEQALRASEAALQESHKQLQETLEELRATREQVIQQERLRAVGEMASGVGHDLNNSLSPVLGYSEMLLEDSRLPGEVHEFLKWIRKGARDAVAVVARLREFYRPPSPGKSRGAVELGGLLDEVVQLTRPKWRDEAQRKGRRIEFEVQSEDAPWVLGNAAEIREVLTNLVFNAVDAMPSGGLIALRLRGQSGGAVVEVADTGIGMSAEDRAKCIEPFFTTKGRKGTGLGLSVCHGIVQRHGGRIEIDSLPGRGTTVRVFLPAAREGRVVEEPVAQVSLPTSRVLYIDDDPRLRSVVADMLRRFGQKVDLADGGARGLELLETNDYDLVITDWGMPGMDGYAVTGKIKALRPELPVAMLTGWGPPGPAGSMKSGDNPDYILPKPPRLNEIRELLMKLMP